MKGHGWWELTPWWHPFRWFGQKWRRWEWDMSTMMGEYDGGWSYASDLERAHIFFKEEFDAS